MHLRENSEERKRTCALHSVNSEVQKSNVWYNPTHVQSEISSSLFSAPYFLAALITYFGAKNISLNMGKNKYF